MIKTGFYPITNCGAPLHYAVDIKPDYAGLAVFEPTPPKTQNGMAGTLQWADLKAYCASPDGFGNRAGFVDLSYNEIFVPDLPGTKHGAIYKGRSYVFANGMNGHDEIVDYSLIDISLSKDGQPLPWRNRFAQSAREKIDHSFRHRAREQISNALVMFQPIVTSFDKVRIELLCDQDPILLNNTEITGRVDDSTIPKDGQWFKQFYFHAVSSDVVRVPAGGQAEVPIALKWNRGGAPCAHALKLKLESDAGYLPKRRLVTDAHGAGRFAVEAQGLSAGDQIAVKINTEHYTAIGKIIVEVV